MSDVTRILKQIEVGDSSAAERLLPLVYEELRKLAAAKLKWEQPGQTLQPTALVHEAFLRLVVEPEGDSAGKPSVWQGKGHFFAAAAEAMRRILVENARRKGRVKHGGGRQRLEMVDVPAPESTIHEDLVALDQSLDRLKAVHPQAVQLVHLRYFAGLTLEDAAELLQVSPRTAGRLWAYARAWLHQDILDAGES